MEEPNTLHNVCTENGPGATNRLILCMAGLLGYTGSALSSLLLGDFAAPGGLAKCSITRTGQAQLQSALETQGLLPGDLFELPRHGLYGEGDRLSRELLRAPVNANEQQYAVARVRILIQAAVNND